MDLDILNKIQQVDLSKVETSFPMLATGNVMCQIVEFDLSMKEKKDGGETYPNAYIKYALAQPWKTVAWDGVPSKEVQPGFTMSENIYLGDWTDPKTGEVKNFGIQRLALLRECIHGKAQEGTAFKQEDLLGQNVMVKLKFDPQPKGKNGETFGPRTEIDGYVRKGGTAK